MKELMMALLLVLSLGLVSAEIHCDLDVSLLNQDPYPAVPGDYVKLVFQVEGVDGADCSDITFNLLSDYPIEFNPEESGLRTFKRINYMKDYESNLLVPYEVRINEDALDGSTPIEIRAQSKGSAPISKTFDVEISDVRTEFEIYVKDYNYQTNEMTLEVLNIGASDIEALSLEIPKQNSIDVKGANKIVVGDLDSNEYTSADFEAVPLDGEFAINLVYSDTINTRRTIIQNITFDSSYFTNRKADEKTTPVWTYIIYGVIILIFLYLVFKRRKNKK